MAQGILSGFAVGAVVAVVGLGSAVLLMEPTQMEPLPENVTIVGRDGATGEEAGAEDAAPTQDAPTQDGGPQQAEAGAAQVDGAPSESVANTEAANTEAANAEAANADAMNADAVSPKVDATDPDDLAAQETDEPASPDVADAADNEPTETTPAQSASAPQTQEQAQEQAQTAADDVAPTEVAPSKDAAPDAAQAADTQTETPDMAGDTVPENRPTMAEAKATGPSVAQSIADEEIAALQPPTAPDAAPLTPETEAPVVMPQDQPEVSTPPAEVPEMQGPQTAEVAPDGVVTPQAEPDGDIAAGAGDSQTEARPTEGEDDQLAALSPDDAPAVIAPVGLPETSVVTNRLPRIGDATDAAPSTAPTLSSAKAIDRNAISFSGAGDLPKMSLLLLDTGPARAEVGDFSLLPFPLSVAVDASAPDAEDAIKFYRENGAEVVLIVPLPEGATPTDVDVTFQAYGPLLNDVVAVMAEESLGFQALGGGAMQVLTNLNEAGLGLVSYTQGLNTAHKAALKEGVPAGQVFRDLDGDGQTPAVIRRFLDNVAFKARNEDGVIAVARVRPDSIQALLEWSLGNRAQSVALAPVSATLPR